MHDLGSVPPSAAVRLQLEGQIFEQVEDWRRSQSEIPSRSKAVRLLLALALSTRPDGPRPPECGRQLSTPSRVAMNSVLRPPSSP
jgi:hypothetical protein